MLITPSPFSTPTHTRIAHPESDSEATVRSGVGLGAMSLFSQALRIHQMLYERSGGLVGHRLLGVPTLLLRTTGARSGLTRTNALVYAKDGDRYLVVASKGGADQAPGWLHNLRSNPSPEVQIGRTRSPASAAILGPEAPDYSRLWRVVNDNNGGRYDEYQKQTKRPIPIVALTLQA
jgi:deazaflavin-dependent oxidoreductase (nitroreductase family)